MNTTITGWGLWRDVPIECFDEWNGKVYFGTTDGRVMVMDVFVDDQKITPTSEFNGEPIKFSVLTTFQDYGQPALFKRGQLCRPEFVSSVKPNFTTDFRYDYDLAEVINTATSDPATTSVWDVGLWDSAVWARGIIEGQSELTGGFGLGRTVAISMSGNCRNETTFIGWDVIWNTGGPI